MISFELLTLFPDALASALAPTAGLLGKAVASGKVVVRTRDLRKYGLGSYNSLDDDPYGGGAGMLMRVEPWAEAIAEVRRDVPGVHVVLLTPDTVPLCQAAVRRLAERPAIALCCPRYEGVDERVRSLVDAEVSIGDFVLSGGEYAALVLIDAVARLVPGVLGNDTSTSAESYSHPGRLEYAQYTRPPDFRGLKVPAVLMGGNHEKIRRYRLRSEVSRTVERRPDLLVRFPLSREELAALDEPE